MRPRHRRLGLLLAGLPDPAFEVTRPVGKLVFLCLDQERVKPTTMVNGA